jgi:hypothetical protein
MDTNNINQVKRDEKQRHFTQKALQQHGHAHATHNLPNDEIEILSSGS